MTNDIAVQAPPQKPSRVRYGVLGLACSLSMITYLDRVCFASVIGYIMIEFNLDQRGRWLLLSAFILAYSVFEVPSGWLGDVYGVRKSLIRIVIWWSAFTALTGMIWPIDGWLVFGFWALVAIRFCFGIGEAGAYPNIARAFHSWFPFQERGFAEGAVWMAGRFMGGATPLIVNGLLFIFTIHAADGSQIVHWRPIFWVFGVLGVAWCGIFWWWFKDKPEQHPGVNAAELELIRAGTHIVKSATRSAVPWLRLLGNRNLWLLCVTYFCSAYGWYFNITNLPDYLKDTYGINKERDPVSAGLLTGCAAALRLNCLPRGRPSHRRLYSEDRQPQVGSAAIWRGRQRRLRPVLLLEHVCSERLPFCFRHLNGCLLERHGHGRGLGQLPGHWTQVLWHCVRVHEHGR